MGLQLSPPPPLPPPYLPALIIVTIVISTLTHVLHYALPPLLTAPSSRHQTSCKLSRVVASWRSSVSRRALAGVPRLARLSVGWVLAGRIILVYPHRLIIFLVFRFGSISSACPVWFGRPGRLAVVAVTAGCWEALPLLPVWRVGVGAETQFPRAERAAAPVPLAVSVSPRLQAW